MKHVHLPIFLALSCISVNFSLCDNNRDTRLNYALKNNTQSRLSGQYNNNNEQQNREDDNALKSEAQKMLKQCGVERNDTNNENNFGGNNDRNGYGGSNANYGQFGQDNNGGSNSNSNNNGWDTYGSPMWNRNQNSGSNKRQTDYNNQQSNSDSNRFGYGNSGNQNNQHGNQNGRPNFGYGNSQNGQDNFNNNGGTNRGYQSSSSNMYGNPNLGFNRGNGQGDDCGNGDNNGYSPKNAFGYNTGMTFGFNRQHRQKRYNYFNRGENDGNDDNQCISQCVFGYLHMLDDDRSPSETMLIKWLQEHVTGNDMDRIKALRDARRCFGRLTTNDIEDGCEFSKELANCLELDLE